MSVCGPVIRNMRTNLEIFLSKIYRSTVNYTKMEESYEYTDRFCLTLVKKEERLSMLDPSCTRKPKSCSKGEAVPKHSTALARYRRTMSFSV